MSATMLWPPATKGRTVRQLRIPLLEHLGTKLTRTHRASVSTHRSLVGGGIGEDARIGTAWKAKSGDGTDGLRAVMHVSELREDTDLVLGCKGVVAILSTKLFIP